MPQGFQGLEIPGQFELPGKPVCSGILQVDRAVQSQVARQALGIGSHGGPLAILRRQLCPCSTRKLRKGLGI